MISVKIALIILRFSTRPRFPFDHFIFRPFWVDSILLSKTGCQRQYKLNECLCVKELLCIGCAFVWQCEINGFGGRHSGNWR